MTDVHTPRDAAIVPVIPDAPVKAKRVLEHDRPIVPIPFDPVLRQAKRHHVEERVRVELEAADDLETVRVRLEVVRA